MNFLNPRMHKGFGDDYQFAVEISESASNRITSSVISSGVEEGGKFLGGITQKGSQVFVDVRTYIDSGPRSSSSQSHLMPDGEHQEYLFRIVEGYDPGIEHIGSWHSHQSNGYPELSEGDIQGYLQNVNHQDYNLDWFFVLLVTQVNKWQRIQAKYYMFHREDKNIYSVPEERIRVVNRAYQYDSILKEAERATFSHRKQSPIVIKRNSDNRPLDEGISSIRAEDKFWFSWKFPSARVVMNNRDDSLSWKWLIPIDREAAEMIYTYPDTFHKGFGKATLAAKFREKQIASFDIELNEERFKEIERVINQVLTTLGNKRRREVC